MIKTVLLLIVGIAILVGTVLLALQSRQKHSHDTGTDAAKGGTFPVFQGEVDGHSVFAMIDMGLRDLPDKQRLPFFLSLSTPLINPTSDGLPIRSDADNLNSWEDTVEARLRSMGELAFVGRVTSEGHRELLYYVNSQQPAIDALKTLSGEHSTRPFAFACEHDEKWTKANFWLNRK